jgi:Thioredoxin-like
MEEVPLLKALHTKYANDAAIIGVSIDSSLSRVDRVIKEKGMTWLILADGQSFDGPIPKAYHIQGTPELFVLDRAGNIFARAESAKQIEASLKEALAQR